MDAPHDWRYRIAQDGTLWQRVTPGRRAPAAGMRRLGRVTGVVLRGPIASSVVTYTTDWTPPATKRKTIATAELVDERPPLHLSPPKDDVLVGGGVGVGGRRRRRVGWRVVWIRLPGSAGDRVVRAWSCTSCKGDLSKYTLFNVIDSPYGPVISLFSPLRCPLCDAPLLRAPSKVIAVPPGTALPRQ